LRIRIIIGIIGIGGDGDDAIETVNCLSFGHIEDWDCVLRVQGKSAVRHAVREREPGESTE